MKDPRRQRVIKIMKNIVELARHARDVDMPLVQLIGFLREYLAELEAIEAQR